MDVKKVYLGDDPDSAQRVQYVQKIYQHLKDKENKSKSASYSRS
jgi:hypothetical protein